MTQTRYTQAAQMFALDTARHEMTVHLDDGVYRHLAFRAPGTGLYWFDLITWPGNLVFRGDMGTYVFSRLNDMFQFFDAQSVRDINPGYWAEKVTAGETTAWSAENFRKLVTEAFTEFGKHHAHAAALWAAIEDEVLVHEEDEHAAMTAAADFKFLEPAARNTTLFTFSDSWEWGRACQDFKHSFLYACFAVRHGVNRYRAHKIESADADAVVAFPALAIPPVPRKQQPELPIPVISARRTVTVQPKEGLL